MKLAEKLVYLRKEKSITQLGLAEKMNISRQAISRWEIGDAIPSMENLKSLSELYHVSVDVLMDDSKDLPSKDECTPAIQTPKGEETKKKVSKQVIAAACILLAVVILLICIVTRPKQNMGTTPIGEMKVEEDDQSTTVGDFSIEW